MIVAQIPPEIRARPGEAIQGEYFFVPDPEAKKPDDVQTSGPMYRMVHASKLRLNAEEYAAALLAGQAEMIEWSFVRKTDRFGEKFEWTRRVVEAKGAEGNAEDGATEPMRDEVTEEDR